MAAAKPPFDPSDLLKLFTPEQLAETPELSDLDSVRELIESLPKKQQNFVAKAVPIVSQMLSSAEAVESQGPTAWAKHFFPQTFSREFTHYQADFWKWGWEIQPDTYYRPRVECEPRGVGKSTNCEAWVVSLLARHRRKTIGYVSRTDDKATQHFNGIKRKLENSALLRTYPHLQPRIQKYRNAFSSWSQDRLITGAGQIVIPITLMGSSRGFKSEDDIRFDTIILDDIDSLDESPDVRAKNLELLKSEIIAAGYANTLFVVPQNLVHRDSIVCMMLDHRADILSDRVFVGPYPLMRWYDAEKVDLSDGGKKWVITAGDPYDKALDKTYCESLLNQFGKDTFDRECQQEVTKVAEDKDFREWDEIYHVITQSEMVAGFERVRLRVDDEFKVPHRWHVGRGLDWGTTRGHPAVNAYVCRPDKTCPHDDAHFVIGEVVLPKFPFDPSVASEVVSPGRVAQGAKFLQEEMGIRTQQIEQSKMSHEASAALNTMIVDLPEELKTFYNKWKAQKGSGVPQIQNMLEIDTKKPHPFRRYPEGHEKAGEPLMGRPRIYFVVADGQGELYLDGSGKLRVTGAQDSYGLARARYEMPLYSHRNQGNKKIDDDFVDALRGLMSTFGVHADELTTSEKVHDAIPEKYRFENVAKAGPITPEKEMALNFQRALARQKLETQDRIVTFDEYDMPIRDGQEDLAESLW
jgi:hypothetical protein